MHALIVAGASGAGKSAFLSALYDGRLPEDVRRHLPPEAQSWPLVYCNHPEQWQRFVTDKDTSTVGFVAHHDVTLHWRRHKQELARDPFWQLLQRCERVTLVVVRPSPRRLLDQWSRDRLGMPPWQVRVRELLVASASRLLRAIRRFRTSKHPRVPDGTRYPRRLRFLKQVDRKLRTYRMPPTRDFDLYRRRGAVEQMLRSWNDMIAGKTANLPVTRIEIVPDPTAKNGRTFGWCMTSIEPMALPPAAQRSPALS